MPPYWLSTVAIISPRITLSLSVMLLDEDVKAFTNNDSYGSLVTVDVFKLAVNVIFCAAIASTPYNGISHSSLGWVFPLVYATVPSASIVCNEFVYLNGDRLLYVLISELYLDNSGIPVIGKFLVWYPLLRVDRTLFWIYDL